MSAVAPAPRSSSQGSDRRSQRWAAEYRRRHSRHRSRSLRRRSPSSSGSSSLSSSPDRRARPHGGHHASVQSSSRPSCEAGLACAVPAPIPVPSPETPLTPAPPGEFSFTGAWGSVDDASGLVPVLKALLAKFDTSPLAMAAVVATPAPALAGFTRKPFFAALVLWVLILMKTQKKRSGITNILIFGRLYRSISILPIGSAAHILRDQLIESLR